MIHIGEYTDDITIISEVAKRLFFSLLARGQIVHLTRLNE